MHSGSVTSVLFLSSSFRSFPRRFCRRLLFGSVNEPLTEPTTEPTIKITEPRSNKKKISCNKFSSYFSALLASVFALSCWFYSILLPVQWRIGRSGKNRRWERQNRGHLKNIIETDFVYHFYFFLGSAASVGGSVICSVSFLIKTIFQKLRKKPDF